jgi:acetyl-CoA C-acetyltransferase
LGALAALKPAFRPDGSITAGNAPGLNSGAAAVIVADRNWAESRGLDPVARLVSYGVAAVEPGMFGLGPIPAVRQALDRAGWKLGDVERIEINEAFAAIAIVVMRELGLPEDIVNIEGGAIAHGHPIGATGAVLTTRLVHSMRRDGLKRGIVTLCAATVSSGESSLCASAAVKASRSRSKLCRDVLTPGDGEPGTW